MILVLVWRDVTFKFRVLHLRRRNFASYNESTDSPVWGLFVYCGFVNLNKHHYFNGALYFQTSFVVLSIVLRLKICSSFWLTTFIVFVYIHWPAVVATLMSIGGDCCQLPPEIPCWTGGKCKLLANPWWVSTVWVHVCLWSVNEGWWLFLGHAQCRLPVCRHSGCQTPVSISMKLVYSRLTTSMSWAMQEDSYMSPSAHTAYHSLRVRRLKVLLTSCDLYTCCLCLIVVSFEFSLYLHTVVCLYKCQRLHRFMSSLGLDREVDVTFIKYLTLLRPLLPYGYSYRASCAGPG